MGAIMMRHLLCSSWKISQVDVKNVFLHVDLHEEVYMQPPPPFEAPAGHVCRLHKALYGLKQAPRAWFEQCSYVVRAVGFFPSEHDHSLSIHTFDRGRTLFPLYVDDMLITGDMIRSTLLVLQESKVSNSRC
jgi:hypothetical protein